METKNILALEELSDEMENVKQSSTNIFETKNLNGSKENLSDEIATDED